MVNLVKPGKKGKPGKVLLFLGEHSYSIYLFEGFFWYKSYEWTSHFTIIEFQDLAYVILSIAFGYVFSRFFIRFIQDEINTIRLRIREKRRTDI